jgi:hypothetical protein
MSQTRVSRSPDLSRLRADGYNIEFKSPSHLVVSEVPYVNSRKEVTRGILVSELDMAGESTAQPQNHVAFFAGECPCGPDGAQLPGTSLLNPTPVFGGIIFNYQLSRKPKQLDGNYRLYVDYYEKIRTYVDIVSGPAQTLTPGITARTFPVVVPADDDDSVFNYLDTASTKSGIVAANKKIAHGKIAIVGVGGTGGYVLDFVAKTPVEEIHIFDGDVFLNHNAYRSPGAPSIGELSDKPTKVAYFLKLYSRMRKKIVPHESFVDETTVEKLKEMSFVFLCIDRPSAKKAIVERLEEWGIAFIHVGMGLEVIDEAVCGQITATTSTPAKRDHFRGRVSLVDGDGDQDYSRDVAIAELNAMNAAFAVVKWKKLCGYYHDLDGEHHCVYAIDGNAMMNNDKSSA